MCDPRHAPGYGGESINKGREADDEGRRAKL
ncbi:hypothetical protein CCACVL1_19836 [Corchorus capsularis]|uniref:Uncharacterized protein n=1 Tax=Corchorus capsularis TaxID=210143 RepID=A0A1R3HEU6_COCAP|nr:hypothetical protein CCACVL1_19836 [Corchorus capsularis]